MRDQQMGEEEKGLVPFTMRVFFLYEIIVPTDTTKKCRERKPIYFLFTRVVVDVVYVRYFIVCYLLSFSSFPCSFLFLFLPPSVHPPLHCLVLPLEKKKLL